MMSTLYMMVGISGSGKSTKAEELAYKQDCKVFSSDKAREELFGNVNEQGRNAELFTYLEDSMIKALENGEDVIYDATNINRNLRKKFFNRISHISCKKVAIVMDTPYEECIKRNNLRNRIVPIKVIKRMYGNFDYPTDKEFDEIIIV